MNYHGIPLINALLMMNSHNDIGNDIATVLNQPIKGIEWVAKDA